MNGENGSECRRRHKTSRKTRLPEVRGPVGGGRTALAKTRNPRVPAVPLRAPGPGRDRSPADVRLVDDSDGRSGRCSQMWNSDDGAARPQTLPLQPATRGSPVEPKSSELIFGAASETGRPHIPLNHIVDAPEGQTVAAPAYPESNEASVRVFEGAFDQSNALLDAFAQRPFDLLLPLSHREQFVGNV
jgi:hypothetical protein